MKSALGKEEKKLLMKEDDVDKKKKIKKGEKNEVKVYLVICILVQ